LSKLVAGLGNPGREYENTRHNIGFMVAEEVARRQRVRLRKMFWFPAMQASCNVAGEKVRVLKPLTYMNRSGRAIYGAMKKWRISAGDTLIVYDDVDLEFGAIRVREKGSGGSHNGMKSVLEWLQTKEFPRVRVGIGPKPKEADMVEFVLGRFSEEESLRLEKVVSCAADAVESVFSIGTERTMNRFNQSKIG
jgi:peptidyl-tRNA hydrolase, PTH1 family